MREIIPGMLIDHKYTIVKMIGEGYFSEVFIADEINDGIAGRRVALKISKSIEIEAATEAAKEYDNMVAALRAGRSSGRRRFIDVYDYGFEEGIGAYIAMELLDRGDIWENIINRHIFSHFHLSEGAISQYAILLFEALHILHMERQNLDCKDRNVLFVHGDINPKNLYIEYDGNVILGDFGQTKRMTTGLSRFGGGQLYYIAPEVFGGQVCAASDVYAAGLCLYKMWTHTQPFEAAGESGVSEEADFARQLQLRHDWTYVPGGDASSIAEKSDKLDKILSKCLKASLNERYRNAEEVLSDLYDAFGTVEDNNSVSGNEEITVEKIEQWWTFGNEYRKYLFYNMAIFSYAKASYYNTVHELLSDEKSIALLQSVINCCRECENTYYGGLYKRKCIRLLRRE